MQKIYVLLIGLLLLYVELPAQERWQQRINYEMEVDFDVNKHQFRGKQKIVYTNNSPDPLNKVFYHLYFNAFQPNSMMDVRSRTIADPDARVKDRISKLKEDEIGYHKILSLKHDGKAVSYEVVGTILEVTLNRPIKPNSTATFEMTFESQVPIQIRRSGRDNKEGIDYSMAQWYPKMAEYDYEGWHAHPYVGREFHGVWGNFDIKITIDSAYTIGGTGYLQNPQEIGKGYQAAGKAVKRPQGSRLTWHFKAPNVHDFVWAADRDYVHTQRTLENGTVLHFFYQPNVATNWQQLPDYMVKSFNLMNKTFGEYPYEQFSFIQGGDGGMEYPMATLVVGEGALRSLVGVSVHESIHNWYYGVLATNESMYPWMDEGFTTYAEDYVMDQLFETNSDNPFAGNYRAYYFLVASGKQEPLSTHADHFEENRTYGISSYAMGALFLHQLSYVVGYETFLKGMKAYFEKWKFKHPNPTDFKRVMEKTADMELDWYFNYWIETTHTIDYGVKHVYSEGNKTKVTLEKVGKFPMPLDIWVTLKGGKLVRYYIPLEIMRGEKQENTDPPLETVILSDWGWVYPTYTWTINHPASEIVAIEIDPTERMADVERSNNSYQQGKTIGVEGTVKK
ncbi:MAG: M1 family metallopeptidase [Bacteroidota bacterium]